MAARPVARQPAQCMSAVIVRLAVVLAVVFCAQPLGSRTAGAASQAATTQDDELGLIAYAGSDGNIWVTDPEGRAPRQVTADGTPERPFTRPRWSPDGTALVFEEGWNSDGVEGDGVYLAKDGVVSQIPVTGCGYPAFLPDGERLIFACGLGDSGSVAPSADELLNDPGLGFVSTSRLDGSDWQVLVPYTVGGFPDWNFRYGRPPMRYMSDVSADGTVLLSVLGMAGSVTIWELDVDDGTLGVADLPSEAEVPDGGSLVYRDAEPLDRDGGMLATRCRGACTMGSSADETISDIVMLDRGSGTVEDILTFPDGVFGNAPSVDPTGQWIAYQSRHGELQGVWVASVPDGSPQAIVAGSYPTWQPVVAEFAASSIAAPPSGDVPMYRIDPGGSGLQPGPAPLVDPEIRWRVPLGGEISGAPVLADEVLFVAGHGGAVQALNPVTGDFRWRVAEEGSLRPVGSPAVSGGTVYMSTTGESVGSEYGYISALDRSSGEQLWELRSYGRPVGSPIVVNTTVLVGTDAGYLYGLDAILGTEEWRYDVGFAVTASPAVAGDTVFVPSADGALHAVDAITGTEQWRFSTGTVQPLTAPTVTDAAVIVGGADGLVYAIDVETGGAIWSFDTGGAILADPVVADGTVYVGSDSGSLFALDAAAGTTRWDVGVGSPIRTTPSATADTVVFGTMDGILHAADVETGDVRWQFETDHYAMSSVLIVDGVVYFGSGDGGLYAIGGLD